MDTLIQVEKTPQETSEIKFEKLEIGSYSKERESGQKERKFMHKQNTEKEEDLRIVDMTLEKLKIDL